MVLAHNDTLCNPQGRGIENMVVVPRADSAGWRMFFAAGGGANCYGWQVFSAVSTDERTWTKESGVRLSNAGQWPVGEGMIVDRLPTGEWRMIVGGFEHVTPAATNTWQITEWRSSDQLEWRYAGVMVSTLAMPTGWQGSVYSPTIRQFAT